MTICTKCGNAIPDDAKFCPRCGEPAGKPTQHVVQGEVQDVVPDEGSRVVRETAQRHAQDEGRDAVGASGPEPGNRRARRMAIMLLVVVVVLVAVVAGLLIWQGSNQRRDEATEAQTAYDAAHQEVTVDIGVTAEGWGQDASPVPIHVEGTDLDGNPVSETLCLTPDASTVELSRGTYTLTAIGSPVTSSGGIFEYPSEDLTVTVGEDGVGVSIGSTQGVSARVSSAASSASASAAAGSSSSTSMVMNAIPTFQFTPVASEDVTDEQLQAISDWMSSAGIDASTAAGYVDSARSAREADQAVYYLELPSPITVSGTQYGDTTDTKIILDGDYSSYLGKTVSFQTGLSVRVTASIASAQVSCIHLNRYSELIKTFE